MKVYPYPTRLLLQPHGTNGDPTVNGLTVPNTIDANDTNAAVTNISEMGTTIAAQDEWWRRLQMRLWLQEVALVVKGNREAERALAKLVERPDQGNRASRRKDAKEAELARRTLAKHLARIGRAELLTPP